MNLFLRGLSPQARAGFAALVHELIHADGRISAQEQVILDRLRAEAGSFDQEAEFMNFDAALASIEDRTQQRAAFIECVGICWSDAVIADEEAVMLDRIADAWSIIPAHRASMVDWVKRQAQLVDDAHALIQAED